MTSVSSRRIAFLVVAAVFLTLLEALGCMTLRHPAVSTDFRQAYGAGRMVLTEPHALYDLSRQKQVQDTLISKQDIPLPFVHPSYEALVYAPFAMLPYSAGYLAFIAFNVALLVVLFFLAPRVFDSGLHILPPVPGVIFFLYIPVLVAIWQGQDSILFLLLCTLVWMQLERGRDVVAACLLALCLFRFQLALPIATLLTLRRGWRFGAAFACGAACVSALCVAITGWPATMQFFDLLRGVSLSGDQSASAQQMFVMHPFAMPNLFGLLFACGTGHLGAHAALAVTAAVYGIVFLLAAVRVRRGDDPAAMAIAVTTAVLISHHLYLHDATLLLLPLALLHDRRLTFIRAAVFYLPLLLFFFVGTQSLFLLAIPALGLLWMAAQPTDGVRA